jgi:hypothetical protein
MDEGVWDHSVFSKNRDRLLEADIATKFLKQVLGLAREHDLISDEHFTVDGTLIEAWAGQKSFVKKDTPTDQRPDDPGNPTVNFHGEERTNDTHQSTTDPEARLYRKGKGKESKLSFMGHVVMDNRYGLVVATIDKGQPAPAAARHIVFVIDLTTLIPKQFIIIPTVRVVKCRVLRV